MTRYFLKWCRYQYLLTVSNPTPQMRITGIPSTIKDGSDVKPSAFEAALVLTAHVTFDEMARIW